MRRVTGLPADLSRRIRRFVLERLARPTGHDPSQCQTCLVRDEQGYKRERLVRVHNRTSARLWLW